LKPWQNDTFVPVVPQLPGISHCTCGVGTYGDDAYFSTQLKFIDKR